jgi:DNA primase large subunit
MKIIKDLFAMEIQKNDDYFVIPVPDYLKHAVHFHEKEWKLVNRLVDNGSVFLSAHETVRLIRKELDNFISSKIQSVSIPLIPNSFKKPISDLLSLAKKFSVQFVETTEYPPCIKHALEVLNKGENLPHSGRFMLATYLLNKGQTIEEIAPLFKNAPDYNEKTTLYQLKHLSGNFGSGTKYSCPSCEKLKSENLCYIIPECNNIINPLQFGRKKVTNA